MFFVRCGKNRRTMASPSMILTSFSPFSAVTESDSGHAGGSCQYRSPSGINVGTGHHQLDHRTVGDRSLAERRNYRIQVSCRCGPS